MDRVVAIKDIYSRGTSGASSPPNVPLPLLKETVDVNVLPPTSPDWRDACVTIKEKLYHSLLNGSFSDGEMNPTLGL